MGMADSNVSISFGADASDFLEGVARVSAALQTLPAGVTQVAQASTDRRRVLRLSAPAQATP